MKKLLSLFLAVTMVLTLVSLPVFAEASDASAIYDETGEIAPIVALDSGLTYDVINDKMTITGYRGGDQDVQIPDEIDGLPVTVIGEAAFAEKKSLKTVRLPEALEIIGVEAFEDCEGLTEISIPDGVTSIGKDAFGSCFSLENVKLPASLTRIEEDTFGECLNLRSIEIPSGVTEIGDSAFDECLSLQSITIPRTVVTIRNEAFEECHRLMDVFYEGSESEWLRISVGIKNQDLLGAAIHFGDGTQSPGITPTPKPTKTPKPTNTPKPTKTPKPTATVKPAETATPTEEPAITEGPAASAEATLAPDTSEEPTPTSEPGTSEEPLPTTGPSETAKPTARPRPTLKPSAATLEGIIIKSPPEDKTVVEGSYPDLDGLEVVGIYRSDNRTWVEEIEDYVLSGFDPSVLGEQTITVRYQGFTAEFTVTVVEKMWEDIEIIHKPDKLTYYQGEELDITGLVVVYEYNNDTLSEDNIVSECDIIGYDPNKIGTQKIEVRHRELAVPYDDDFTDDFTVRVKARPGEPEGDVVKEVEKPDIHITGFIGGKTVTLTCDTPNAQIYYTKDGSTPTVDPAFLYTEPFTISVTSTIKAVAVLGDVRSKTAGGKITVAKVKTPRANRETGSSVKAGTVITLDSPTHGAMIYYTTDGTDPTTDGTTPTTDAARYKDGIVISSNVHHIKAIAVKDGYVTSDVFEADYNVLYDEVTMASISVGSAIGTAGDIISLPVYIFTDSQYKINSYRLTLKYNAEMFECLSVTPPEDVVTNGLFTSINETEGTVTIHYNGASLESGEVCNINFLARASDIDGDYEVTVVPESVKIDNHNNDNIDISNGKITLEGSANSDLESSVVLTNPNGDNITDDSTVSGEVTANVTLENIGAQTPSQLGTVSIILAVYDREGCLVDMSTSAADLSELNYVFTNTVNIPENIEVGSIKLMIWNDLGGMNPMEGASEIYKRNYN